MRRTARAKTRLRQQNTDSVSLFPFLAVLICTMGSLIVLLVVIARQAQVQAARAAEAEQAGRRERFSQDREMAQLMRSQLLEARKKTEAQLAEARLVLGHIEEHTRRLEKDLARLQAAAAELESLKASRKRSERDSGAELASVRREIEETESRLAEARRMAASRRESFAVVPYRGPHETYRRPIYIECLPDGVVIQPEGVVLTEADFSGPLGPGNPLETALRATREYLLEQQRFDPESSGEPYPLLLVRPGGIMAYYAARAAMKSWASDFGYELIEADWQLAFPPSDPQLARTVARAIDAARVRQELLIAAVPNLYGGGDGAKYRAAPYRGGAVMVPGTGRGDRNVGFGDAASGGFQSQRPSGHVGSRAGTDGGALEDPRGRYQGTTGNSALSAYEDGGQGAGGNPAQENQAAETGASEAAAPAAGAALPEGVILGRPPRESDRPFTPGSTPSRPGEWAPSQPAGGRAPDGADPQASSATPMADTRGSNWGLPNAALGSIPITRPIGVDCHADRLTILPAEGRGGGHVIPLDSATEESVDELISAVWERIDSWGMAGKGMYWQPLLKVHVAPGAEDRFADLQVLLDRSGLEVARKTD